MRKRALVFALIWLSAACARTPKGTVRIDLDEFKVLAKPSSIDAGPVRFEEKNAGAIPHELIVISTALTARDLPLEGAEVDLTAKTLTVAARDKQLAAGKTRTLRTQLASGRYVLICNVPGHYQSGMRSAFRVR